VWEGDLYRALPDELRGRVDVVVANAPYVPADAVALMPPEAREHEPTHALNGGADGLEVLRAVIAGAPDWLAPAGGLAVECSVAQAIAVAGLLRRAGLDPLIAHDPARGATAVIGEGSPDQAERRGRSSG
jgi:release factor glutamine methyltransferase